MEATQPNFSLKNPILIAGVLTFFANQFMDANFNLPVGDLLFPFLSLALVLKERSLGDVFKSPGIVLTALLIVWMTLSNLVHGVSFFGQFRSTFAVTTLFLPIFLFVITKNKAALLAYVLGTILGFSLFFVGSAAVDMLHGGLARDLRGILPTPVVILAFLALFYKTISVPLRAVLISLVIFGIIIAFGVEARGAAISIFMGLAIWLVVRYSPWPRATVAALVMFGLMAHFISSFFVTSSFDALMETDQTTVSNLERAYAIDYSRMILKENPWFGDSPQSYAINFADYFDYTAGFSQKGDKIASPHNTFLEFGVFFGYPAAYLLLLLVGWLFFKGTATRTSARSLCVAFCAAGIIRLGALYGFSGIYRIEWFALMFLIMYFYTMQEDETALPTLNGGKHQPPKPAAKPKA